MPVSRVQSRAIPAYCGCRARICSHDRSRRTPSSESFMQNCLNSSRLVSRKRASRASHPLIFHRRSIVAHPLFGCIKLFSLAHHDATRLHGPAHGRPRCRRRAAAQYHQFHALWVGTTGGKLARHGTAPPLERFAEGGLALDTQVRMRLSAGGGWIRTSGSAKDKRDFETVSCAIL